jgi:hypothetical protein
LRAKVPGKAPLRLGPEEMVFPPRQVDIPPGKPITLGEAEGACVMARYGGSGLVEVPEGATPDQIEGYLEAAQRLRYGHLRRQIDDYQLQQQERQATGGAVRLPNENVRAMYREAKKLGNELIAKDEILKDVLPKVEGEGQPAPDVDPIKYELEQMGISGEAVKMQPGVSVTGGNIALESQVQLPDIPL